jgi:hypothetical protein
MVMSSKGIRCKAMKKNGQPCNAWAQGEGGFCFMHDPARAGERSAARKLGGFVTRARHGSDASALPGRIRSLDDVLLILDYTLQELLSVENSIVRARALIALAGEYRAAITDSELVDRLAALEAVVNELVSKGR